MNSTDVLRILHEHRVALQVRDLTVSVKGSKEKKDVEKSDLSSIEAPKRILDNVSFDLDSGEMLAIMGGSGSGKTTLLNTLSQRLNVSNKLLEFGGKIDYITDDLQPLQLEKKVKNSFLQQTDAFLPGLTLLETLKFQADLRLPSSVSDFEKMALIDSLLEVLELNHRKNDIVMSFTKKINLSGGEQRRASLTIQLLSKPSILFLDEPTTGLDTSSSLKMIQVLKKLASPEFGVTIILSIHQPRPEITTLFDKICLLTRGGRLVYFGSLKDSISYFRAREGDAALKGLQNTVKDHEFLEYIMSLSVKDTSSREKELATSKMIDSLVENWAEQAPRDAISLSREEAKAHFEQNRRALARPEHEKISFLKEVSVLTKRTFIMSSRDTSSLLGLVGGTAVFAVALGWMFFKPTPDLAGIRSITSSLYAMLEFIGFIPLFLELERLWVFDGSFFFREYKENYVSIPGFILSRRLAKLFVEDIPLTFLFASISYFMWGLRMGETVDSTTTQSSHFFIYLAVAVLIHYTSMATAMASFAMAPDYSISMLLVNSFYQLQNSASGYFINAATMPVYVRWIKYISYFWYAFGALTANQYTNWMGKCPYDKDSEQCIQYSGNYQLSVLGYPQNWIAEPIGILVCWVLFFYLLCAAGLRFRNYDIEVAGTKKNRIGTEEEAEDNATCEEVTLVSALPSTANSEDEEKDIEIRRDDIEINLENLNLSVGIAAENSKFYEFKRTERVLLDGISASFVPNDVNVIMGPSGGGKTTLLNFLSNRLPKSSSYKASGAIKLNGTQAISPAELARASAYVSQHDTSLIPNLTVRETLFYQAKLRLPVQEHPRIPLIINKLIRETGLLDCADTLIGSETVKGISGGEKRRVSISIQLLSKPKILFLDEPTSGLDSSTSVAILSLLDRLARKNGTTVILTIHQPSENMFDTFGSVLLLAKGGRVVYSGVTSSIHIYLALAGYNIPKDINTADYILDLVSVRVGETQETTTARVAHLLQNWARANHSDYSGSLSETGEVDLKKYRVEKLPSWITFSTILRRQFLNSIRATDIVVARAGQTVLLAVIHTLFFAPLKNGPEGVSNRLGLIQEVCLMLFVGLVNNISLYPTERDIFHQEYKDGIYGVLEFSSAYILNEVPIELATSCFFAAMLVFAAGLPREPGMYFTFLLSTFTAVNCGESFGIFFTSVFNHLGLATNVLSYILTLTSFMAGTMSLHLPPFFEAWNYLNPLKYAVAVCAKLAFRGQHFGCGETAECSLDTGEAVLEFYGLDHSLPGSFGALVGILVAYRVVAVAALYVRVKWLS